MKHMVSLSLLSTALLYFVSSSASGTNDYAAFLLLIKKIDEKTTYTKTAQTENQLENMALELSQRLYSCITWGNQGECKKINNFFATLQKTDNASCPVEKKLTEMIKFRMALAGFGDITY